jgi:hypothetical protein
MAIIVIDGASFAWNGLEVVPATTVAKNAHW